MEGTTQCGIARSTKAMTTAQYNAGLLPLCTQALQQSQPEFDSGIRTLPVRICPKHANQSVFKLQLAMHRQRMGEVQAAERTLSLLDKLMGPLVGQALQVEILEQSYGQYAQFALEVDTRQNLYRVRKTMNGQTWTLAQESSLAGILQFIQHSVYLADDDGSMLSNR